MSHTTSSKMGSTTTVGGAVYSWPDGWREALISAMDADRTPFLMNALQAWNKSTPLDPYTNNPLGMPYAPGQTPQLLNSGYALFPATTAFRTRFVSFLHSAPGADLRHALLTGEDLGPLWRAIHALGWPANNTETDYPAALLDLMTAPVREKLQSTDPDARKTSGTVGYSAVSQGGTRALGQALQRAANAALGASSALRNTSGK